MNNKSNKKRNWDKMIRKAKKEMNQSRIYYKDKPVNGDPTPKQIRYLEVLCKNKGLNLSIIGLTKKKANDLITYLKNGTSEVPKCYNDHISI